MNRHDYNCYCAMCRPNNYPGDEVTFPHPSKHPFPASEAERIRREQEPQAITRKEQ